MSWSEEDRRRMQALVEQSSLGTPRARQIRTIGHNQGKFTEIDMLDLCIDAMTNLDVSIKDHEEDLGNNVSRVIRIVDGDDEEGWLEVEVRFTHDLNQAGPDKRFRIKVEIKELEP